MAGFTKLYESAMNFYERGLWEENHADSRLFGRVAKSVLRRVVLTVRAFFDERMQYRASALTYTTLLSIVPLLSIVFAIAKGFGLQQLIEGEIRRAFQAQPEVIETLIGFVNSYLSHARGGVFLGFGLLLLLWTLISLTSSIEGTFNQIWQVKRQRSVFRKVTDYTAVFFMLPIVILVSAGISIFINSFVESLPDDLLRPAVLTVLKFVPYIIMCLLFTAMFTFMPNTKVNLRSALTAGIPCGIAFQALQFFYINSQIWLSSYNAIYGSFAALPLFMFWCQLSWYICLMGATLSYVDQNIDNFYYGQKTVATDRRYHDFLCLSLVASVNHRFVERGQPYSAEELAREKQIPIRLVTDILYELCAQQLLLEVTNDEKGDMAVFVPACELSKMSVGKLLSELDGEEVYDELLSVERYGSLWENYVNLREEMFAASFKTMTVEDFANRQPEVARKD